MRILVVSDAWKPQVNGVVRTYEDLGRNLEEQGHIFKVIGPADFPFRRPMPGYTEIELVFFPKRRLKKMIAEFSPDTIHIATEGPLGWAARSICKANDWPFTTIYHTQFPDYAAMRAAKIFPALYEPVKSIGIKIVGRFHNLSSAVMTSTKSIDDVLKDWNFKAPLHRLTRGVDTSIFHPGPKTLFGDLPKPVALYVGRVAIEKNIETFLDMPWPGSKVIVGDGPSLPALKAKYPGAFFVGKKIGHDLANHYRSADIFVFPSRTDTFGIVLIEAMACGLPIAGHPAPGPADIVTEQQLGSINEDLAAAAQTALHAPGTPEDRFQHLMNNFTWPIATKQFLDAQNKALIGKS